MEPKSPNDPRYRVAMDLHDTGGSPGAVPFDEAANNPPDFLFWKAKPI
ncbi:MAG: hypothetical protein ACTSRS_02605 [Candidatus Helarchaeota archaeon]